MQGSCLFISSVRKHGRDGKKYPHRPYADGGVAVKEVLLSEAAYSHHGLTNASPMANKSGASDSAVFSRTHLACCPFFWLLFMLPYVPFNLNLSHFEIAVEFDTLYRELAGPCALYSNLSSC